MLELGGEGGVWICITYNQRIKLLSQSLGNLLSLRALTDFEDIQFVF